MFKLANPKTLRERGIMGMNQRNCAYIGRYNDRKLFPNVDDKTKTKTLAMEYGIAALLISVVAIMSMGQTGEEVNNLYTDVEGAVGTVADNQ